MQKKIINKYNKLSKKGREGGEGITIKQASKAFQAGYTAGIPCRLVGRKILKFKI